MACSLVQNTFVEKNDSGLALFYIDIEVSVSDSYELITKVLL